MISKGRPSEDPLPSLDGIREADIAAYYFNIKSIPCLINSPLRPDKKPSFALYSPNGVEVNYRDFSNKEGGRLWTLLQKLWNCSYNEAVTRVFKDLKGNYSNTDIRTSSRRSVKVNPNIDLKCKVREWRDYDIKYWGEYGISIEWLKFADVYPISHKIVVKDGVDYVYGCDKYAYAYAEFKEGRTTLKIYQPFNTNGYKWSNRHDKSVISLWTKVPKKGRIVCICSSLKDALCLWANTGIPSVAIQGEGYKISNTAVNELKRRFSRVFICLDNDKPGIEDAQRLSEETGFINIVLPQFEGGKDISDLYKVLSDKTVFKQTILKLFNYD